VRLENIGRRLVYVVPPRLATIALFAAGDRSVVYSGGIGGRRVPRVLDASQIVALQPGEVLERPVPGFEGHREDASSAAAYSLNRRRGIFVPPGDYLAQYTYVNAPDYELAYYDSEGMPESLWEGFIVSDALQFSVVSPSSEQIARTVAAFESTNDFSLAWAFQAVAAPESTNMLLERFREEPVGRDLILSAFRWQNSAWRNRLFDTILQLPSDVQATVVRYRELTGIVREPVDCRVLDWVATKLDRSADIFWRPVFKEHAEACPSLRDVLRMNLQDVGLSAERRGQSAALLGAYRHADDRTLLIGTLDSLSAMLSGVKDASAEPLGRGVALGLGMSGGTESRDALVRALRNQRMNALVGPAIVEALYEMSASVDVVPALEAALDSVLERTLAAVSHRTYLLNGSAKSRVLTRLVDMPNLTTRRSVAYDLLLLESSDATADASMRRLSQSDDDRTRRIARAYLAKRGDSVSLEQLIGDLESPDQSARGIATSAIRQSGSERDFPRIRAALENSNAYVRGSADYALELLTFFEREGSRGRGPAHWDAWYDRHRRSTRTEWAIEAIHRPDDLIPDRNMGKVGALEFLARRPSAAIRPALDHALASKKPEVRIAAAKALAGIDRNAAINALIRELGGRFVGGCDGARTALIDLIGAVRQIDCRDPDARMKLATELRSVPAR
jgi:HEAT repeat protein